MSGAQRKAQQAEAQGATGAIDGSGTPPAARSDTEAGGAPPDPQANKPPEGAPTTPTVTVTSPDGVVQNLVVNATAAIVNVSGDFGPIVDDTLLEVVDGRAIPHAIKPELQLGGTKLRARDVYNGVEGALTMLRKGALQVVHTDE